MPDTQPIDVVESGVQVGYAKAMEKSAKKCYTDGHCVKDANPILRPTFDRAQMNKTMQILTFTYSVSRVSLIATLLLVNLVPPSVQAKEGPSNIWGVNAKNQIFTWTGNGWRQVAGELKYVSAGSDSTRLGCEQEG